MRRRQILAAGNSGCPYAKPLTLEERYFKKFGKKPHWKMKRETIEARLRDDTGK